MFLFTTPTATPQAPVNPVVNAIRDAEARRAAEPEPSGTSA